MKTHVSRSVVFFALLLPLAAEHFAFLPLVHAQVAQAGAAVPVQPPAGAGRQLLRDHVPGVLGQLQPISRLAATNRLNLAFGLALRNPEALTEFLAQLHNPAHPNYRHYLTADEFAARFGPTEQDYQMVVAFAQANGLAVRSTHSNRALLDVNGSVADIERALHLTLSVYDHPAEARTFYAPEAEPALDLAVPVLGISGLNNYSLPRPRLHATPLNQQPDATPNTGSGPGGTYLGNDFRTAYLPDSLLTGAGQTVGLLQFDGYHTSDIAYYETRAGLPSVPLSNVLLDGFNGNPTGSGGEVEVCLDIETAISMAPGLAGVIVYMAGPYGNFHDILNRMATDNLAKQLSCSWYIPRGGADPVADQIFQQMAAQGQSFFNASGDYDAFTGPVDFPGETPYIVQVGGTTLTTSGPGGAWVSEKVWNWNNGIGTGGGISTRYAIPSYQTDINMTLSQGSTTMRNIPDVALTADNVYVRANGRDYNVGGTSCAAPLWAGFAALVNQQAVASGRPVVGFINPAADVIGGGSLYTTCFHDITTGNNTSAGSPSKFYAVAGYDLCTGWGTPAGQNLINALATPDPLFVTPAGLAFSGGVGGPFSPNPAWLTLTNTGTNTLSWTLVNTSAWFNLSPSSGTLLPGGAAASVSVSVAASAGTLPPGVYPAVVWVTNVDSAVAQSHSLALSVAVPNMFDDFDSGLDLTQWSSFGGVVGSTVLATNYGGSVSAPNSLWFGDGHSRFATTVPINTSGGGQLGFCLRLANGSAWPWARPDNLPDEGVVLECSTNGGSGWTIIGDYDTPAYYNWTGVVLPIPAAAQGAAALFRWRQLSNSGTNYDHWALDNVIIGTGPMAPKILMDPQTQNGAVGDPASLSVAAVGTRPLSYQWLLNGTNINGATTSALVWTSVQLSDAGTYAVYLSNSFGTVMSSNAVLTPYVPVCAPPSPGLVSWWQGEGNSLDQAGINNGTLAGNTTYVPGRVGQGFVFDGNGDAVMVGNPASLQMQDFTIESWVKRSSSSITSYGTSGNGIIFGYGYAGYGLYLDSSGRPVLTKVGINDVRPTTAITDTNFHHVAVTKSGSSVIFYVDGTANAAAAYNPGFSFSTDAAIGARGDNLDNSFVGIIDEVALYNRALSGSEIQAICGARGAGKCADPVAPLIQTQPADQTVTEGGTASFTVAASGTPPLFYQWRLNGSLLAQATNSILALIAITTNHAGLYSVMVSNVQGSALSSNATLTVNPLGACVSPASGLVSWWRGEGDAIDQSSTNNGILSGNTIFGPGRVGQAFVLDGSGDTVSVGNSANLQMQDFTIESWVKRSSSSTVSYGTAGIGMIFGYGHGGYGLYLDSAGVPALTKVDIDEVKPTIAITDTDFHHLAVSKSGSTVVFYVDGVAYAASAYNPGFVFSTVAAIGARGDNLNNSFLGAIDEVAVYNRTLTAGEIQTIYSAGSAGKCTPRNPPGILSQPSDQTVLLGQTAAFNVRATGTSPLFYQWQFNGSVLAKATNSTFMLTATTTNQSGLYSVLVSNAYGWTVSSNAVLTVNLPPPCSPAAAGIVSWWKGEGDTKDQVGTNNGTLVGNATYGPGYVGQGFVFDGSGDTVRVGNPVNLQMQDFTIESWIKRSSGSVVSYGTAGIGMIFGYGSGGYGLYLDSAGVPALTKVDIGQVKPTIAITDTSFHHLAVSKSGSTVVFYVDGVAHAASAYNPGFAFSTVAAIGARGDNLNNSFWGTIDEVAVYNRALTAGEIQTIYSAANGGKCGLAPSVQMPPSSQNVECSSNATFAVTATGLAPLAYRWYFGLNPIAGATNALLTLSNVGFARAGAYSVVVTNAYGSATGGPAVLTVVDTIPPTIISCASNRTFSVGANCTVSLPDLTGEVAAADASGVVIVTQFPASGSQLGLGVTNMVFTARDSSGNTSICSTRLVVADTTPPFVQACVLEVALSFDTNCQALLPDLTGTNYIIATDNCSLVSVAQSPPPNTALPAGTNVIMLTVSDSASNQTTRAVVVIVAGEPRIALQPTNVSGVLSSNTTFSVIACGALPLDYQWQHSSTNLLSATNVALTLINLKTNDAGDYQVVITNSSGSITSAVATLTVLQPPVITWQPRNAVAAPGATVSFFVAANGLAPLAYQWQKDGAPLADQTNEFLTISNIRPADFTGYTVGITNTDGGVLSEVAMLSLAASPIINSVNFNSSTFILFVPTEVGPSYVVEYKNDLEEPGWTVLATLSGTGSSIPITDNRVTNTTRFYRVRVR